MWAMGFGNHLTIVGILPAAVIYGIVKDRSVLRPRVAITAAIIGIIGVLQYWFIAIRTMQGAPYLEARATTIMGVFDVIIARDVSWARFYQAQSAVAAIEVPMLLNGIRVNMGTIPIILVVIAIGIGIWKKNADVLLIFGAAAGTLGMIANLWGDVVGFITPVCVQLWPLAAFGLQVLATRLSANPSSARCRPGVVAMIAPVTNVISNRPRIELLQDAGRRSGRSRVVCAAAGALGDRRRKLLARAARQLHAFLRRGRSPIRIRACSTTTPPRCAPRWRTASRSTRSKARRTG